MGKLDYDAQERARRDERRRFGAMVREDIALRESRARARANYCHACAALLTEDDQRLGVLCAACRERGV